MFVRPLALTMAVAAAAANPAFAHRAINLRLPHFDVSPGVDREVCTFVRVPMNGDYDIGGYAIHGLAANAGEGSTSHHFLLYAYTGSDIDAFADVEGAIVDSKNCLDFGPNDSTSRILLAGAQAPRAFARYPKGLAMRITPSDTSQGKAIGFILNSHWINASTQVMPGGVKVKLIPAKKKQVKKVLKPIFEVVGNAFIDVPPGAVKTAGWQWSPGGANAGAGNGGSPYPSGDACVLSVTGHMHKWGTLFTADYTSGDSHERVYATDDYEHPGQTVFQPARLVKVGEHIEYACTHDNGVAKPQKLGCEEVAGEAPGLSIVAALKAGRGLNGAAAKNCTSEGADAAECPTTDPAYPDRSFTGQCVPANLVFGFTSKDEMCLMSGSYYDADPNAAPGHECDVE